MLPVCIREQLKDLGLDVQHDCVAIQAGLSGASVYRVGDYAIKQHPLSSLQRLGLIHQYQKRSADSLPNLVPGLVSWPGSLRHAIPTVLVIADNEHPSAQGCWECIKWMPGESIAKIEQVGIEQVLAVSHALGLLHRHSRHLHSNFDSSDLGDERMLQRERLFQQLLNTRLSSQHRVLDRLATRPKRSALNNNFLDEFSDAFIDCLRFALGVAMRIAIDSQRAMQKLCQATKLRYPTHGDAWRGNWLFEGFRVSGLIDFSQSDIRWPGFDFSRAIGTMVLSDRLLWNEAWGSYCEVLGDPGYELNEAMLMHRVSTVLTLVSYIDRMGQNEAIGLQERVRIEEVCKGLRLYFDTAH
jgi:hypothetical protein